MKQLIREKVFETNSSSCHSISLADMTSKQVLLDTIYPDEDGNVVLEGGKFGWEIAKYNDARSKASYAMVYALDWAGDRSTEFQEILKTVIKEHTGANEVQFRAIGVNYDNTPDFGYIDHQSVEDRDLDYLFEDPELLRNFIFNKNSILYTDNDNHY